MFFIQKKKILNQSSIYKKLSYSQSGEDLIAKHIFDSIGISKPTYIDIGAHHPYYLSNTALFSKFGSFGINIEPDPNLFKEFLKERTKDINLNIGISNYKGEQDFYVMNVPTLNTFSKVEAEKCCLEGDYHISNIIKIKTDTVLNIVLNHANNIFPNFLSIDAEGIDELVIDSIDFNNNYPIVICIETISFSTSGKGVKNLNLIKKIKDSGYILYADTYINSIFIREKNWVR